VGIVVEKTGELVGESVVSATGDKVGIGAIVAATGAAVGKFISSAPMTLNMAAIGLPVTPEASGPQKG
jgi:hypothetical protein